MRKSYVIIAVALSIVVAGYVFVSTLKNELPEISFRNIVKRPKPITLSDPEISAWIAWWEENKAYTFIRKNPQTLSSVSPLWFLINENLELIEVGSSEKEYLSNDFLTNDIEFYPTIGSELNGKDLSPIFREPLKSELIERIVNKLIAYDAHGLDIDLEAIDETDKENFTAFMQDLQTSLHDNKLKLIATLHPQTEKVEWEGVLGQDLRKIGEIADIVRIMVYDRHSSSTSAGPITPLDWLEDVIEYSLENIDRDKIVIGLPTYGYIWYENGEVEGIQYYDFTNKVNDGYSKTRNPQSQELIFENEGTIGYLSDYKAIISKIDVARKLGINKFILWHLGGMDEQLFEQQFQPVDYFE